jgi:hypothetical protein
MTRRNIRLTAAILPSFVFACFLSYHVGWQASKIDTWTNTDLRIWGVFDGSENGPNGIFSGQCDYLPVVDKNGPHGEGMLAICAADRRLEQKGKLKNFAMKLTYNAATSY